MLGVNLWGLMPLCREDLPGVLRRLKDMGAESVEGLLVPKKKDRFASGAVSTAESFGAFYAAARAAGLSVPSVHVFYRVGKRNIPLPGVISALRTLSREYGVESFAFSGAFTDAPGARKWARYMNTLARALEGEACSVVYHNHDQELHTVLVRGEEKLALDYFLELTREDVLLQLDIGWAGMGADEVALAQKHAGRIHSIHLKDFCPGSRGNYHNPQVPKDRFCPIGEGEIRTGEVLALRHTFPKFRGLVIIDQDFSAGDILEDIRLGCRNTMNYLKEEAT